MKALDRICKDMPVQVVDLQGGGKVNIQHRLVNTLHDGKERLFMCQHLVAEYLKVGVAKKPAGFGQRDKVSTQTCMVCLTDPKTYSQVESLSALPVMFEDIKGYSMSPMHIRMRLVS